MLNTNQTISEIYCKGRYSLDGKIPCKDSFSYLGKWGDKELVEHQNKETENDSKHDWWVGFDVSKKFDNLKTKIDEVIDDRR